jgi:hypothetical protein
MACLDTSLLLDATGKNGRNSKAQARRKLDTLVAVGEVLTTTRFNIAELWVGVEAPAITQRKCGRSRESWNL